MPIPFRKLGAGICTFQIFPDCAWCFVHVCITRLDMPVHVTQVLCICQSRKIPQRLTAVSPALFPARARVSGCTGTRYQQFIRSRWMPRLEPRNLGGMPSRRGDTVQPTLTSGRISQQAHLNSRILEPVLALLCKQGWYRWVYLWLSFQSASRRLTRAGGKNVHIIHKH